jgi:uncharacterized protein
MNMELVARFSEKVQLDEAMRSPQAELIAVYGRRRVGKTFLIRQHFAKSICFELVGIHDATLAIQLGSFASALKDAKSKPGKRSSRETPESPADWHQAFAQLRGFVAPRLRLRKKQVVFFDELPWLAARRSGFLPAFEHFWNSWGAQQSQLVVVVCGSAASWMLDKIVSQRSGLHNRVTRRIRVEPFSIADAHTLLQRRGVNLGHYQTVELYMALGGIPFYLAQVRKSESAAQNIDRLCFSRDGLLRSEFDNLYASLFEQSERHENVVKVLATKRSGLTRGELLAATNIGSGGAATKVLNELEQSGFIFQIPQLGHLSRDSRYWLADEYSLFYLTWIAKLPSGEKGTWMSRQGTPAWRAWSGLAFEAVCLKHVAAIKHALGIAGVATVASSWSHRTKSGAANAGAQIDLVIDRADRTTNLCEMKFSETEFVVDKSYAAKLLHKRNTFRTETLSKKALLVTLVTTFGVRDNDHARGVVNQSVTLDALFAANA